MTRIGYDTETGEGINGALFQEELLRLDTMGKKRVQVWINSVGGDVLDGFNIYNAILKSKTPVDTYCVGMAASMAAVIFQAGRKRIMADYGILMFHNPYIPGGTTDQTVIDMISSMKISCNKMISSRSGMDGSAVDKILAKDTFMNADEAYSLKLCDTVELSSVHNIKYLRKETDPVNYARACAEIVNKVLVNDKNQNMSQDLTKITMRLKLNDAARPEDVVTAIDGIEQRAIVAESRITAITSELEQKENAHANAITDLNGKLTIETAALLKAKTDLEAVQAKLTAMETDKVNAEKETKKVEAKTMITGYAKAGRIKNEATIVLEWETLAETIGLEKVKAMLEALPLNKMAPVMTEATAIELAKGELPTTAMGMAVKNKLKREGKSA